MTPYVDLSYFLLLLCPLLVLVVLGLLGLLRRPVVLGASLAIVLFQYGNPTGDAGSLRELSVLVAYVAGSVAVVLAYACTTGAGARSTPPSASSSRRSC